MRKIIGIIVFIALLLCSFGVVSKVEAAEENSSQTTPSQMATIPEQSKPEQTKDENAKKQDSKIDRTKADNEKTSETHSKFTGWEADVFAPLVRFAGIALILGALVYFLDLPSVLRAEAWSERTILAFAVIFTYCAAALMGTTEVLGLLKDVALLTLGFYFGSSKGSREEQTPQKKYPTPTTPDKPSDPAPSPNTVQPANKT